MNHYIEHYHRALNANFHGLASVIAHLFYEEYRISIDEAYASMCRNGTAYNSPAFIPNCSHRGAPDL